MAKIPNIEELFGAGRAPRPTNPRLTEGRSAQVMQMPERPPPISRDPWFDELTSESGQNLFVFVTNPRGQRVRIAGPFPDQGAADQALSRLRTKNQNVELSVGPWTPG